MDTGNYSAHRIIWSWYTGRWWVGCYIWYSEKGPGRAGAPPSPLLADIDNDAVFEKVITVKYALVFNTQGNFSLLSTEKIKVHVYNVHQLLLKSLQWQASGLPRFDEHTPTSVSVVCVGGPCKQVNVASVWILRNVLLVTVGWAKVAAAGGTKLYCGWSLGEMSIVWM